MENKEILKFCLQKGLLLDGDALSLFNGLSDINSVKLLLEKIKINTGEKIITRGLFERNREQLNEFVLTLPEENQKSFEKFKIKLGLNIEISREVSSVIENKVLNETSVLVFSENVVKGKKVVVSDFVNYFRNRFYDMKSILQEKPELNGLTSINKLSRDSQSVSLIGIISNKTITKNKNIIFEIEDLTGKIKVLVNCKKEALFKEAEDISLDSVIGFKGSGNREIFFVNDIFFPDAVLSERKKSLKDESVVFIGDLHYGSKLFLEENFLKFIDYLNGNVPNTPEAEKIKYLFIVGDLITGVGNYPNQEADLKVGGVEEQFSCIANLLGKIRSDIKIIISPGNHDCVRLMEPQPKINEKYAWPLYKMKNVFITENPCNINIGAVPGFSGFNILTYHGFSFFYYVNNVQS